MSDKKLSGKTALITGASKGLGKAMALALGAAGARLALVSRNRDQLQAVAKETQDLGAEAEVFTADVTDEAQVRRMETEVINRFGNVQILINNAGINIRKPAPEFTLADWRAVLDTNLTSVFMMCRAFVPQMKGQGYGRIVNLTSIMSHVALPQRSAYCASKAGLMGFTRALALELAGEKITVNGISPGPFATEMNIPILQNPEANTQFVSRIPLGRSAGDRSTGGLPLLGGCRVHHGHRHSDRWRLDGAVTSQVMSPVIAEFFGTALLILLGDGVVANVVLNKSKAQNAGWMLVATGWGLAVALAVYCVGWISGGHLNPAVTVALAVIGRFDLALVPAYVAAQMAGAFLGAVLVWLAYLAHWKETADPSAKLGVFCTAPAVRKAGPNLITEIIGTFVLVLGVLAILSPKNLKHTQGFDSDLGPLLVGLLVLGIGVSLGGPTGYAINPARDLGPRIAHALLPISGKGHSDWGYAWIPVVGPLFGGILGALLYRALWGA